MTIMHSLAHSVHSRALRFIGHLKYQLFERQFVHTYRIGLVVSTIALTLLMAVLLAERGMIGLAIVGGIAALCVLLFTYHFLHYMVFALIFTTTVAAPPLQRDVTTTLILLILLAVMWLTRLLLAERSFKSVRPALPNRVVPIFALIVLISFVWSNLYVDLEVAFLQNDRILPRIVTGLVMILSPVAMLLFGNFMRDMKDIKRVVWCYLAFGVVVLASLLVGLTLPNFINIRGQLPVWVSLFALGQALFNQNLARWMRVGMLLVAAGWLYVQFGLGATWLSGWVPLVGGFFIVFALRSRASIIFMAALVVLYVVLNINDLMLLIEAENTESGETRLAAGNYALNIANQHFLFGTGPTGYYFYMTVYVGGLFQLSHNNYVDIYAQLGILGFVTWIILWASIGWTVWQAYRRTPKHGFEGGLAAALVAIYVITLLIMMLGDWVIPFTYTQTMRGLSYTIWPWLWAGLAIALNHLMRQAQPVSELASADAPPQSR